jgi:hypothetical protein
MTSNVYIGLCVTSHNAATATVAELSGAATTGNVTGAWQQVWIGDDPDRTNDTAPLYVTVTDSAGQSATVIHPDPAAVNVNSWAEWKILLSDVKGVNLAKVKKLTIGKIPITMQANYHQAHVKCSSSTRSRSITLTSKSSTASSAPRLP